MNQGLSAVIHKIDDIAKACKTIEKTLKKEAKEPPIDKRVINNLERLSNSEVKYFIADKMYDPSNPNNKMTTKGLIETQEKGLYPNGTPRPFLEPFKKSLDLGIPDSAVRPSASFGTIKKDVEDEVWVQFIDAMQKNKLGLSPLKYREGTPLYLTGKMVGAVEWKVVENEA